ncbi:AraC family transcriptional regulator [Kineosporia sp. J2-2]|uniref:AraC family transcriptional regulator n=1 Tax=Kineosporia corallincola TaxID=2835133 RepID=A0ABS5TMC6_9ACTN|nr:helix-turn-helix domain-containing protein [Kineosporia corallincola]MBT0772237.1 AraC family transcriptional regulator [Kineosporia corallincola]
MTYSERPAGRPGVTVWQSAGSSPSLILPDGCLDLMWDGEHLHVAGPDSTAHLHVPRGDGERWTALRFGAGTGPVALGVPADALLDRRVPLADLWGTRRAAALERRVATDGATALENWLRRAPAPEDPLGERVFTLIGAGTPVARTADRVGLSPRQLQRRSRELFGYGAGHLLRVLRLQRALARTRAGIPPARVAAETGYCDQAHLSREVKALTGRTPGQLSGANRST